VRVHPPVDAGSPIWQMARLQSRRHGALLRAALARGRNDQVLATEDPRPGHGLAVLQRGEEGIEGIAKGTVPSSGPGTGAADTAIQLRRVESVRPASQP